MKKAPEAFRTISEVSELLQTPAHVLRFWESRFAQIKPIKRGGGRRYYRPSDIALLRGLKRLLHEEGITIRGVQKILKEQGVRHVAALVAEQGPPSSAPEFVAERSPPLSTPAPVGEEAPSPSMPAPQEAGPSAPAPVEALSAPAPVGEEALSPSSTPARQEEEPFVAAARALAVPPISARLLARRLARLHPQSLSPAARQEIAKALHRARSLRQSFEAAL